MERRRFLQLAGGTTLAVLGAGGLIFSRETKMVALPAEPLSFFTPREFSIFHSAAEALIHVPEGQPSITQVPVAQRADAMMSMAPGDSQKDFKKLLALFDNALAGLVLTGNAAPFTQMPVDQRRLVLAQWQSHRIGVLRSGFVALKRAAMSCYYSHESTWRGIGYPGPVEIAQ